MEHAQRDFLLLYRPGCVAIGEYLPEITIRNVENDRLLVRCAVASF
jgi:hypothetical protein